MATEQPPVVSRPELVDVTPQDDPRWRRDLRVRGYEELAKEFYLYRATIHRCAELTRDSEDFNDAVRAHREHHAIWNRTLTSLWIHGSESAASAAYALDHELSLLSAAAIDDRIAASDWPTRREPVQQKFDNYLDAVRADLSLPTLKVLRANAQDRVP